MTPCQQPRYQWAYDAAIEYERGPGYKRAVELCKEACKGCPLTLECLRDNPDQPGVIAGTHARGESRMSPDDPRHGKNSGYINGCREDCCREATNRYHKRLVLDHARGIRRLVDATGTRRRIEALMALGYSGEVIARELRPGIGSDEVRQYRTRPQVRLTTAKMVAATYERLSMRLPVGTDHRTRNIISRTRNHARRNGWVVPLAWDDIDNDPAPVTAPRARRGIDEAVVIRVLAGEHLPTTRAEKDEITRRWRALGKPTNELERLFGWRPERYGRTA